jgi:hypothetical protein
MEKRTLYRGDISREASLPKLMSIPIIAWTNKNKAIEIPKRRWTVRTFSEVIVFSLANTKA